MRFVVVKEDGTLVALAPGPITLRVGKTSQSGGNQDFGGAGDTGFNRIKWVRVYGK